MVNSLRKFDFFAPYWPLYMAIFRAPLRKSWVRPCSTLSRLALHCLTLPFRSCPVLPTISSLSQPRPRPFMTHPGPVRRCPALLGTSRPCLDLSCAVGPGPALPIPARLCSALSSLVRSCPACMNYFSCHYVCSMYCANPNCPVLGSRATMVK